MKLTTYRCRSCDGKCHRHGNVKNKQRWKCKQCGTTNSVSNGSLILQGVISGVSGNWVACAYKPVVTINPGDVVYFEIDVESIDFTTAYAYLGQGSGAHPAYGQVLQEGMNSFTMTANDLLSNVSISVNVPPSNGSGNHQVIVNSIKVWKVETQLVTESLCYGNDAGEYRYGFNGMEMDDEVKGEKGTHLDFGARCYDSRVGRFLSRDAYANKFVSYSPYSFAGNMPIVAIDNDGDSVLFYSESGTYLGYSNDNERYKGKNLLVIIKDSDVSNFKKHYEFRRNDLNETNSENFKSRKEKGTEEQYREASVAGLAKMGREVFDVGAFNDFLDKTKDKKMIDGKMVDLDADQLPVEFGADVDFVTINKGKYNELTVLAPNESTMYSDNSPVDVTQLTTGQYGGKYHTHPGGGNPQEPQGQDLQNVKGTNYNPSYPSFRSVSSLTKFTVYTGTSKTSGVKIPINTNAYNSESKKLEKVKFTDSSNKTNGSKF